jgi:transposase-like protein
MTKQQKTYTREFKVEAVQLVKSSGKPMSQIARELGISDSALSRLVQAIRRPGRASLPWQWTSDRTGRGTPSSEAGTGSHPAGA